MKRKYFFVEKQIKLERKYSKLMRNYFEEMKLNVNVTM